MTTYFALIQKDDDSAFGVVFPDVPGCFSAGDSFDEAVRNAGEALRLHVEAIETLGRQVPRARSFDELMRDRDVTAELTAAAIIPVSLAAPDEPVDVLVSLEPGLLDDVDDAAAREGISRSEFLARAAREKVAG